MNRIQSYLLYLTVPFSISLGLIPLSSASTQLEPKEVKQREIIPLYGPFKVNRYLLDNGLRLLVIEDHSSPTFAYQTWYRVGSKNEVPGRTGLAHLFEHMMFKETKTLKEGDFDKLLEEAGVEGENAFTSRDYTAYIQELPKDKLDLIAKLESDRMVNLVINQVAFKTERDVVQNERRFRNENSPDGLMDQELFGLAFTKHPYHWPVIGYQDDLDRMSDQNALEFYHTYYRPNHASIIVVGDVDPENVRATVQKYYGPLPMKVTSAHAIPNEPPQQTPRRKELKLNIQVEKLFFGYHVPGISHPDIPVLQVAQSILTGGKSSRLHRSLVETGLASSVDSYDLEDKDPSLLMIVINMQKNKHAAQAEPIILKELARLSQELVSPQELERAKNKINFDFYSGLESNFERAYFLGHFEALTGDFMEGIKLHEKNQSVSPLDIKKVAKRYFTPSNRTVVVGVPK